MNARPAAQQVKVKNYEEAAEKVVKHDIDELTDMFGKSTKMSD